MKLIVSKTLGKGPNQIELRIEHEFEPEMIASAYAAAEGIQSEQDELRQRLAILWTSIEERGRRLKQRKKK